MSCTRVSNVSHRWFCVCISDMNYEIVFPLRFHSDPIMVGIRSQKVHSNGYLKTDRMWPQDWKGTPAKAIPIPVSWHQMTIDFTPMIWRPAISNSQWLYPTTSLWNLESYQRTVSTISIIYIQLYSIISYPHDMPVSLSISPSHCQEVGHQIHR